MALLEFDGVCFSYESGERVLEDINLKVEYGDFLGLIGPNGGGKTTLIKLALGLLEPKCGRITVFGKNISEFKEWHRIGYVAQKISFEQGFPATVREIASMGRFTKRGLFNRLLEEDYSAIEDALSTVGMLEHKDKKIGELSGGQQQRVFIARALASGPELILLDEPTTGVDIKTQNSFYELLNKLNKELGITLVWVTHDVGVVLKQVSKIACINKNLFLHGRPSELYDRDLSNIFGGEYFQVITHHHDRINLTHQHSMGKND